MRHLVQWQFSALTEVTCGIMSGLVVVVVVVVVVVMVVVVVGGGRVRGKLVGAIVTALLLILSQNAGPVKIERVSGVLLTGEHTQGVLPTDIPRGFHPKNTQGVR